MTDFLLLLSQFVLVILAVFLVFVLMIFIYKLIAGVLRVETQRDQSLIEKHTYSKRSDLS
jgi:hypothetical protein